MRIFSIILFLFILSGCHRQEKREARELLGRIEKSFQENKYNRLKLQVDSLNQLHRSNVSLRKKANEYLYKVELFESERTLSYLSNLVPQKKMVLDSVFQYFVLDKTEPYQQTGEYVHKNIAKERNAMSTYLKVHMKENGEVFLISIYCGWNDCTYQNVKVFNNDFYVYSPTLELRNIQNYAFKTSGHYWRMLLFTEEESMEMIQFIDSQFNTRISVSLTGPGCSYEYVLKDKYKKAIRDTYYLSLLFREVGYLKADMEKTQKQIELIKEKIAAQK